jgi:hypothetical protein
MHMITSKCSRLYGKTVIEISFESCGLVSISLWDEYLLNLFIREKCELIYTIEVEASPSIFGFAIRSCLVAIESDDTTCAESICFMVPWESLESGWIREFDSPADSARLEIGAIWMDDTSFTIIPESYRESSIDTIDDSLSCVCYELLSSIRESTWEVPFDIVSGNEKSTHTKKNK